MKRPEAPQPEKKPEMPKAEPKAEPKPEAPKAPKAERKPEPPKAPKAERKPEAPKAEPTAEKKPQEYVPAEPGSVEEKIETFVKGLLEHMDSKAVPHCFKEESCSYKVDLVGDDLG